MIITLVMLLIYFCGIAVSIVINNGYQFNLTDIILVGSAFLCIAVCYLSRDLMLKDSVNKNNRRVGIISIILTPLAITLICIGYIIGGIKLALIVTPVFQIVVAAILVLVRGKKFTYYYSGKNITKEGLLVQIATSSTIESLMNGYILVSALFVLFMSFNIIFVINCITILLLFSLHVLKIVYLNRLK